MILSAIIVDDEKPARDLILEYLAIHPKIKVIAQCWNGEDAVQTINTMQPDIIFLDIRMPGYGGFKVLERLERIPIIIFSTAYSSYALQAFEVSAVDYLLKPYTQQRFDKAVNNALKKKENPDISRQVLQLLETIQRQKTKEFLKRIFVKTGDRMTPLNVSVIEYIKAEDDYIRIYSDSKNYLTDQTLSGLLSMLDPEMFIRIHRSYVVNLQYIKEIQKTFKGNYSVHMGSGTKLPVGRTFLQKLKNHII